ncbi:MAG: FAD-dependent oxidoreductase [Eubacteriales bacterium]|jgi:2-enoate reductase|nr:FAD-dependent oxidoreductase [Clostridium sp.]MCI6215001.1 FAD-dependent oxidoreductase [Clostridiales bacterium]MDY2971459.1 FAD-dependent oxidoreductase [Eubacteriales bacterium]MEE0399946.1 FAD-dependent oxidoreductase [Christensenellales bacterium]MBS5859395.1 FAD-dependent oxidoreductase [Clostridium sp.]
MDSKYESLFTPWKIKNCEIKNRIVMTSMGGTSIFGWMEPNHFDKEAANFLLERAKNNVGLILPGIAPIRDILLGKWLYQGKGKFKKLKEFMDEFHKTGAKMFVQLTAGFGRSLAINDIMVKALHNKALATVLKPALDVSYLTASASATPNRWQESCISRPLTQKEIHEMVEAFAKTAKLCMDAGVDGVEIHAVHEGYLLDQFTMKYTNQRTDEYGGSFENRYRFPVEIVKAIKKACGDDFPVSLRYSVVSKTKGFGKGALPGEDYVEVGRDMEESERAAKYLQDAGYDMLNCDNGTYDAWYWAHPGPYMPQNCNLEDVAHIKKFVDIPVVCAGRMEPDVGAEAIAEGKIDGLGVARQFLTDPAWVTKLMNDDIASIHPCICCHNACFDMASYKGDDGQLVGNDQTLADNAGMARCALNPQTMQSKKYKIVKAARPKKIAVIGGGIGGMEVARVATLRGHKVTIYEKSNVLGGVFIAAAAPSFKEKDRDLIKWYEKEIKDLNIEVKFNTEVKPEDIAKLGADEVVVATGSKARKLRVPGAEKGIEACEYLLGTKEVGNKVIVIGGGLSGCEIALDLYNKGKTPVIVEMKNDLVAMRGVCLANTSYLRDFFALNKVDVRLNTGLVEITDKGVKVKDLKTGKESEIAGDSVIMSVGYIPTPVAKDGVKLVGDCNGIGNLRTVIWRAWDVAMKL